MSQKIPSKSDIDYFFKPFVTTFVYGKIKRRKWYTAASKFYHFVRSDVFPILDRKAKAFYDVKDNDPGHFHHVLDIMYQILYANKFKNIDVKKLEVKDKSFENSFQGRIKMMDKIAFMVNSSSMVFTICQEIPGRIQP